VHSRLNDPRRLVSQNPSGSWDVAESRRLALSLSHCLWRHRRQKSTKPKSRCGFLSCRSGVDDAIASRENECNKRETMG
jgi:hypothetical protein